jgi:hypothetical protein
LSKIIEIISKKVHNEVIKNSCLIETINLRKRIIIKNKMRINEKEIEIIIKLKIEK